MPLMKRLGELGISLESLDSYLIAKHAEERNVFIAKFNDNMPDGGSGISTADAKKALAKVASDGQSKQMAELSQIIYDMNDYNITAMEEGGLIDNDLAVELRSNFKYYVPLKGKDGVKDSMGSGQGYSIGSNGIITALGRGTGNNAESPTVHALLQAEQTAIRSGKSTVGRAFIKMIAENPNPDLYSMTSSNYQRYINTETGETFEGFDKDQIPEGLVEDRHYKRVSFVTPQEKKAAKLAGRKAVRKVVYRIDPNYKERDEIFSTMVDGKAVQIEIKDPVAMEQLKKINATELGVVVQNLGTVNRFLAMINTALNPEFVITNLERDLQTAGINLAGEQGVEMAKEAMKNVPKAAKGIWANLKNGDVESEWAALFQELQEQGGTIGFFGLEDAETKFLNMQKQLQRQGTVMGRSLEKLDVLKEYVLDANASVENAVRLTAYKAAKDSGMSKAQAANLSKNLTVNFNRRGELAPILNSTYLFFNASIQGSARIMTAYKNPRVRKYLNGVVMLGFTMAVYNMEAGGEDEDGVSNWEKISPYIKSTHFIVMNPDGSGDYFKIKMPYGYNVFAYTGMAAADLAFGKQTTVMATGVNILTAALNAFNPIQGATALDTITPTALKPFVQSEFNYNFMNTPIRPENKFDNYERPDSDKAFLNTNQSLKDIAKYLNSATGGDDTRSGFIDVSPESMKHFTNWLTGGAGAFVGRLGGLVDMTARGDAPGISDIPFLRSLTGGNTNFYDNNEFYQSVNDINAVRAQYKRHVDTQTGNAGSYLKDNAGVYRLSEKLSKVKKRLKYIRTQRNEAKRKGLFEKAKRLDADVAKEMRRFNSLFRSAQTRDQDK